MKTTITRNGLIPVSLFFLLLAGANRAGCAGAGPDFFEIGRLQEHVRFLSSADLKGRAAGSEGAAKAAEYIAAMFGEIGLEPVDGDGFFQRFSHRFDEERGGESSLRNVIGVVDREKQGTVLLIGAHFDHLGVGAGKIYFGADDNASGTATLIELASFFSAENVHDGPVVFAAFTGEEDGLLGSRQYIRDPLYPLDRTVMVNIDMVGRLDGKPLLIALEGLSEEDRVRFNAAADSLHPVREMRSGYEAGDLAPFVESRVPSLFLFTGPHADYHRPSDVEEKIDYAGLRDVGLFASRAIPRFTRLAAKGGDFAGHRPPIHAPSPEGGVRPFLGTVPDFTALPEEGVVVADVVPGSPAEAAGILPGDRILRLDDREIADLRAFAGALRERKPGETVRITLGRGDEELTVQARLESKTGGAGRSGGHPGS